MLIEILPNEGNTARLLSEGVDIGEVIFRTNSAEYGLTRKPFISEDEALENYGCPRCESGRDYIYIAINKLEQLIEDIDDLKSEAIKRKLSEIVDLLE